MKNFLLTGIAAVCLIACNNSRQNENQSLPEIVEEADFFPVTSYLKGQIAEIKSSGVNPLKITTVNNKVDSVWLKLEEFDAAFAEFITQQIDSANMAAYFKESKFLDQTLATYTFTYEPKKAIPAGIMLKRWDVYINPENERVKRIYIEKTTADKKELQLSWQSRGLSKIVFIATDASGKQAIEKEEIIKWNFDDEDL